MVEGSDVSSDALDDTGVSGDFFSRPACEPLFEVDLVGELGFAVRWRIRGCW